MARKKRFSDGNELAAHADVFQPARESWRQQELIVPPAAVGGLNHVHWRQKLEVLLPLRLRDDSRIGEDDRVSAGGVPRTGFFPVRIFCFGIRNKHACFLIGYCKSSRRRSMTPIA